VSKNPPETRKPSKRIAEPSTTATGRVRAKLAVWEIVCERFGSASTSATSIAS
jgi:hypothetical protein